MFMNRLRALPRDDGALAPEIRAAAKPSRGGIDARGDHTGGDAVRRPDQQLVSARLQILDDGRGKRGLDLEDARLRPMIVEGADRMQRIDPRRLDRGLHVEPEIDDVEQHEENLLILTVATLSLIHI